MRRIVLAALLIAGSQEAGAKKKLLIPVEQFSAAEIAWASGSGAAEIKGSALLRTQGGDAKTCAGLPVLLIPVSAYSTERMLNEFGPAMKGLQLSRSKEFATTDPGYRSSMRQTRCDAQGDFEFTDLPAGSYYVVATVTWNAPSRFGLLPQGGELLERVDLSQGGTKKVLLTA